MIFLSKKPLKTSRRLIDSVFREPNEPLTGVERLKKGSARTP